VNIPSPEAIEDLVPTRQSLLSRLKDLDDDESWREFFQTYWKLIYATARRAGLTDAQAQDVVQETIISVCKHLPGYRYDPARGSFKNWMLAITRWRIIDRLRSGRSEDRVFAKRDGSGASTEMIESIPDTTLPAVDEVWDEEWERNLFQAAVQRVKATVSPRQYQIFDLIVLKQWPSKKVCQALGVNAAQVYVAKHRITALIKKAVKVLEAKSGPKP
jgi:RNA polymerase sigma factor (sigma-70 family)